MLTSFAEACGATPLTLVGHSLGGWLAMLLALKHPERFKNLVLLNPAGVWTDGYEDVARAFDINSVADTRALLQRLWFRLPWYVRPFINSVSEELQNRRVFELIQNIGREEFVNDRLSGLPGRTSLIWGREDQLLPRQTVDIFRHHLPGMGLTLIPRCGHVPQLECPRQTAEALRQALMQ